MEKLNTDKHNLKKFGVSMGLAFSIITLIVYLRQKHIFLPWILVSGVFFASAVLRPAVLRPLYIFWMRLAFALAWINTRLILSLIFYLMLTPIGLAIKLFGIDLLDRRIDRKAGSYWKSKEGLPFDPAGYERQF